ncbi:MAG: hypothetical protein ACFFG0_33905 [Candidatus Thorarchaeota archaeon]
MWLQIIGADQILEFAVLNHEIVTVTLEKQKKRKMLDIMFFGCKI